MKIIRNVVIALVLVLALCITSKSFAKTVIVTTDGLNLRREASTEAEVLDIISINEEVEYVDEQENWYKVKYKGMTGYISKDYAKIKGENTTNSNTTNTTNTTNNNETNSNTQTNNQNTTSNTQSQNTNTNTNNNVQANGNTNTEQGQNANQIENNVNNENTNTNSNENTNVSTSKNMKFKEDTAGCILPLINANVTYNFKKDAVVKAISFVNGWTYVESQATNAWVRTDKLAETDEKIATPPANTNTEEPTDTQEPTDNNPENPDISGQIEVTPMNPKIMYVQEPSIYVRSGPGTTYDVVDTLIINNTVTVTGKINDWYQVKIDDKIAYIADWLLGNSAKETTSRGSAARSNETLASGIAQKAENIQNEDTTKTSEVVQSAEENNASGAVETISKGEQIVNYAKQYLGCKYVYGGSGPNVFDCSGFTMYVYKNFGISLSHSATAQSKKGTYVAKEDLQPGDLVFFKDYETMNGIGHCGIYIGEGNFIHASSGTGYCVKISNLLSGSYSTRYETARRVI